MLEKKILIGGFTHNGKTDFYQYRININTILEPILRPNKM